LASGSADSIWENQLGGNGEHRGGTIHIMAAKLEKPLQREVVLKQDTHRVTSSPLGLKLVRNGHRKGLELLCMTS